MGDNSDNCNFCCSRVYWIFFANIGLPRKGAVPILGTVKENDETVTILNDLAG